MRKKRIMLGVVFILLATSAYAIGISPSKADLVFSPGEEKEMSFRIINNEYKNMKVSIYLRGDLKDFITLEDEIVNLSQDEPEKTVSYKVKLPAKPTPGLHSVDIVAVEYGDSAQEGNIVVANIGVIHRVDIRVPYPDRYLEGILYISDARPNELVTFTTVVANLGDKDISKVTGQLTITGPKNEGVVSKQTNSISLKTKEKSKIIAEWIPNVLPGTYKAQIVIDYDGKITIIDKEFDIGEPLVNIDDLRVASFKLGTIAKLDIILSNKWNMPMTDVYSTTEIRDSKGNLIDTYKTGAFTIPMLSTYETSAYWDTKDILADEYLLSVRAHYLGRVREKTYGLDVKENAIDVKPSDITGHVSDEGAADAESGGPNTIMIIVGGIALIVIGIIVNNLLIGRLSGQKNQKADENTTNRPIEHPEIKVYIKQKLKQGYTRESLRQTLMGKGWKREIIDEEMLKAEDEMEYGQ